MKLILFDIDGTLVHSGGAGRRALEQALLEVYGTTGPIDAYDFAGGTDPQIVQDLMAAAGLSRDEVVARESRLYARYVECLEAEIGAGERVTLYPGVAALVQTLAATETCVVGLLTGNIEDGARIKLRPTGLWPRFRVGAYGSDHGDRRRLPAVAADRAEALVGRTFRGGDVVVVGDTPRDIDCARAFDATAVAVATGRHRVSDLAPHRPDHLFGDLSDTARVVDALLGEG